MNKKVTCNNARCSAFGKCTLTAYECNLFKYPNETKECRISSVNLLTSEDSEQETVIDYCNLKRIVAIHIPNESPRSISYGAKMRRMGLRKGFPDIFIPTAMKGYNGLMIELKCNKKSRVSAEQTAWIEYLNKQGYKALICYGADEAIRTIDAYFEK